jgi:hypothetical protein
MRLEYINAIGQAESLAGTDLGATWLREQLHRLKHTGPLEVLAEMRKLRENYPQVEEIGERLAYLEKRVDPMAVSHLSGGRMANWVGELRAVPTKW